VTTPWPTPTPALFTLPAITDDFSGQGDGAGTASYDEFPPTSQLVPGDITRMEMTASWGFSCTGTPQPDPFAIELPDGTHQAGFGPGGLGSTWATVGGSNVAFSVTADPTCQWHLTVTMTPETW
jgi:hypothetical protein